RAAPAGVRVFGMRRVLSGSAYRSRHGVHAMSDVIIEAKGVTKTFGSGAREVRALRGIDLVVNRGELTLLMGPSGSGKTTLLLILGCMLTPTRGTVTGRGTPTSNADKDGLATMSRHH